MGLCVGELHHVTDRPRAFDFFQSILSASFSRSIDIKGHRKLVDTIEEASLYFHYVPNILPYHFLRRNIFGETTMSNLSGKGVLILNEGLQHYRPHALINFSLEVCKRQ